MRWYPSRRARKARVATGKMWVRRDPARLHLECVGDDSLTLEFEHVEGERLYWVLHQFYGLGQVGQLDVELLGDSEDGLE